MGARASFGSISVMTQACILLGRVDGSFALSGTGSAEAVDADASRDVTVWLNQKQSRHDALQVEQVLETELPLIEQPDIELGLKDVSQQNLGGIYRHQFESS